MRRTASEAARDRYRQGSASRRPIRQATQRGVLVAGASCFVLLHTHSADGIISARSCSCESSALLIASSGIVLGRLRGCRGVDCVGGAVDMDLDGAPPLPEVTSI